MQGHPPPRLLRTVSCQVPPSLASTPMCFRARHLSFSLPSHHNPQGAACNPQRPLNFHTWMHCTPGWGVGKRVASPKISWSPANHVTARLQPRCSRVHTLRGQNLTAEWGPPSPSDSIWLLPGAGPRGTPGCGRVGGWVTKPFLGGEEAAGGRSRLQTSVPCSLFHQISPTNHSVTNKIINNFKRAITTLNQCAYFWEWGFMLTAQFLCPWNRSCWYFTVIKSLWCVKKKKKIIQHHSPNSHHSFCHFRMPRGRKFVNILHFLNFCHFLIQSSTVSGPCKWLSVGSH